MCPAGINTITSRIRALLAERESTAPAASATNRAAPPAISSVDHPAHYGAASDPYEAIKVIEAWRLGFCLGNTVKYVSRAGKKGHALEDLRKARWYLTRAIEALEAGRPVT